MQAIQSNAGHSIPSIRPFMQEEKEHGVITSVASAALEFIRSIFSNLATLALTPFYFITNLTSLSGEKESFPSSPKSNGSTTDPASSSLMQTLIDNRKAIIATVSIGLGLAATYAAYYYMSSPLGTTAPLPQTTVNGVQFNFDLLSGTIATVVVLGAAYGAYRIAASCLRIEPPSAPKSEERKLYEASKTELREKFQQLKSQMLSLKKDTTASELAHMYFTKKNREIDKARLEELKSALNPAPFKRLVFLRIVEFLIRKGKITINENNNKLIGLEKLDLLMLAEILVAAKKQQEKRAAAPVSNNNNAQENPTAQADASPSHDAKERE